MPLANAARSFQFMHLPHVAVIVLIVVASAVLCVAARKLGRPPLTRAIAWALALVLLVNELISWTQALSSVGGREFLAHYLPLHICGAAVFLTAIVLITRNQFLYEVMYYWALAGTLQAVITPDMNTPFPEYRFFQYFTSHGCVVVGVAFATWGMRMRPGPGSVWRAFGVTLAFAAFVGLANYLLRPLGANYMFLCDAAGGASPFFFLPWPWYIPFIAVTSLGVFWLLYLPFVISRRQEP